MDAAVTDTLVGRVLDGRYRVEARLARGGMATVYTATDLRLDRLVAVKVMHSVFAEDDEFVARFIREAKAAARLSHPNVVAVYDQGEDDGHVFLTMEYVQGRTLRDLMNERGSLSGAEALSILQPVASALSAAHQAGLVHRDVKPENVLLADDGRVKVADFGLARAVAGRQTTATSALIGTVAYLAPEQVTRGVADARSDVYAAGIMLYEMLTGAAPYGGETPIAVAYRHAHEDVPPPSAQAGDVPPLLDHLVQRSTSRDPDARPADAGVLLAEVVRARRSLPALQADGRSPTAFTPAGSNDTLVVALPDETTFARPPRPATARRRRRRMWGIIALVIVLLAGAAAVGAGWWFASGRYVSTPKLTSLTWSQASTRAHEDGVKLVRSDDVYSETVKKGAVVSQDPGSGDQLERGGTVTVHVSKGRQPIPVTDFTGKSASDAQAELAADHLKPEVTQQYSDDVKSGLVISQDPKSGDLHSGDKVKLVVSQGPAPVQIGDWTSKSFDDASKALHDKGLHVDVTWANSDTTDKGFVISQNPKNTTVHRGDHIAITVSKGPVMVTVPDETGNDVSDATAALKALGFDVKTRKALFSSGTKVYHQDPGSGASVKKGTPVTLYYGF